MIDTHDRATKSRPGTQTLERGLDLLALVVSEPMRVDDLAVQSGLHSATARRLLASLKDRGYVVTTKNGCFEAGPKLFELGAEAQRGLNLVGIARKYLLALSAEYGITSFLGQREGDNSLHLFRAPGTERVIDATPVGTRRCLAETSLGRSLMLDDPEAEWVRIFSHAAEDYNDATWREKMRTARELDLVVHHSPPPDNLRAVGAPVRDAHGAIVAAISMVSAVQSSDTEWLQTIAYAVQASAEKISRDLGYAGERPGDLHGGRYCRHCAHCRLAQEYKTKRSASR